MKKSKNHYENVGKLTMNYKETIIKYCNDLGVYSIGFTKCRVFEELRELFLKRKAEGRENEFEEIDIEKRINPLCYMEDGKTIISLAFPYICENIPKSKIHFSKYTLGMDYHKVLGKYLENICNFIESIGGKAKYFVDSNALPERYLAYLSGVGFIGKNNMIITERYGSYVFLGEIITDLQIEEDSPMESQCRDCNLCIKVCPANAITGDKINPNKCLSYISQRKDIDEEEMIKLKGRMFGCDTCQDVCPYNKNVAFSEIKEFQPFEFMKNISCEEILSMSKKDFNEKYKLTSCGWRGKNVLQRNMLISLHHLKKLESGKKFSSSYVQEYYDKLLKKEEN